MKNTDSPVFGPVAPGRPTRQLLVASGLAISCLLAAPLAMSQVREGFLHQFSSWFAGPEELNHNFDTLRASLNPVGSLVPFAGDFVPEGWLLCDGSEVSASEYPELAATLGDSWGVAAPGAVRLPDLRGRFLRGAHGPELDPDGDRAVGSTQSEDFMRHGHAGPRHSHRLFTAVKNVDLRPGNAPIHFPGDVGRTTKPASGNTGPAGGDETRPDNAAVNYIIRASELIAP